MTKFRDFWQPYGGFSVWSVLFVLTVLLILFTAYFVVVDWSGGPLQPSQLSHTMPEEDLANLWSAGHLARLGRLDWIYSSALFQEWKQGQFGQSLLAQDWIYPPTVLFIGVPLSFVPLMSAFFVWDAATLAIAVFLLRYARLPWPVLVAGLAAPATWRSLILGQYGVITGALVVAGLLVAPRHPIRAGLMLGLATVKPQQGAIVPVAWIAANYRRAFAAAAIAFATLAVGVCLWLGSRAWTLFLVQSSAMAAGILNAPPPQPYMGTGVSVFWMLRTMGLGVGYAYMGQIAGAVVAVISVFRAWRRQNVDPLARIAFTACASLMITPYGYTSDMVGYSISVAIIVANNRWRLRYIDILLWLWPACCPILTGVTGVLFTPLVILGACTQAWRQMARPHCGVAGIPSNNAL